MEKTMIPINSQYIMKKIWIHFGIAFIFVFMFFNMYQLYLIFKTLNNPANIYMLIIYSIPIGFVISTPFSVCIGFTQGLIKINIIEKISASIKRIMPIIISGVVISIATFIVGDLVMPEASINFSVLYRKAFSGNEDIIIGIKKSPREMSSRELLQYIKENELNEKMHNMYVMEINKKYSIPFSILVFTCFAISLSLFLYRRPEIALGLCILLCFLYYGLLVFGQSISLGIGQYGFWAMWFPNIIFLIVSIILYIIKVKGKCV
jgi:lipopolysaccharide export LptBFGC system permease protein LptF